jgi:hypothetical protein
MNLEILVPVFNEEKSIEVFLVQYAEVIQVIELQYMIDVKITFLDNASTDSTYQQIEILQNVSKTPVGAYKWVRNYGVMTSIYGGLIRSESDIAYVVDVDLQEPPQLLLILIEEFLKGVSFVSGSRNKRIEPLALTTFRNIFRRVYRALSAENSEPVESGAWLLDKAIIEDLRVNPPQTTYLAGILQSRNYSRKTIQYSRTTRKMGESKFGLKKYFSYAFEGLVQHPLRFMRMFLTASLLTALTLVSLVAVIVIEKVFGLSYIPNGITLLFATQVLSASVIIVLLGVVGEYVARIFKSQSRLEIPVAIKSLNRQV